MMIAPLAPNRVSFKDVEVYDRSQALVQPKASSSFLKKRTKKLLFITAYAAGWNRDSDTKVFCFFSSEKKILLVCRSSVTEIDKESAGKQVDRIELFPREILPPPAYRALEERACSSRLK